MIRVSRGGAITGAALGGIVWGLAFAGIIGLFPWCKYEAVFLWLCPSACGVVCPIYLCFLRAPDKSFAEEEQLDFLSSFLGEFASALPSSLICAPILAVMLSFLP